MVIHTAIEDSDANTNIPVSMTFKINITKKFNIKF